jgi:hypothetical protein
MNLTLDSKITVPEGVLFRDVGGEAVILNLETGKYYGLEGVGVRMWSLLADHRQLRPVYQALLDEYDVSEELLLKDLLRLVNDLVSQGLVQVDET